MNPQTPALRPAPEGPQGWSLLLAHWILLAVACGVAGWSLSALHFLNPIGYLLALPLLHFSLARLCGIGLPRFHHLASAFRTKRWKHPLPACFLIVAMLAILGGILHPPNNLDALHYRMPRVAHWLMDEQWNWFPANNNSQNTRSAGFEWMTAPIISLTGTDRFIFVINAISHLLLPGACFMLFRGMGIGTRVSRAWMWLVPTAYCFALQAGSVGNDLAASLFAVAAFGFAFRWKAHGGYSDFAIAMAAAAVMTACKPSTIPLLLPFAVIFFGMWKPAISRPVRTAALAITLATGSFLTTAALNLHHCGDWTGLSAENPDYAKVDPLVGIAGNLINAPLQNLAPPIFPIANQWNSWFVEIFPQGFRNAMAESFDSTAAVFTLPDIQGEEWAGFGAPLTYLLLATFAMAWWRRKSNPAPVGSRLAPLYGLLFFTAFLLYASKTGLYTVARHISPYYPFFAGTLLLAFNSRFLLKSRVWQICSIAAMASAAFMVVFTPARPLWPANAFFSRFGDDPQSTIIARASEGFSIYRDRSNALGPLREALPDDVTLVGFISFASGSEMPFWRPYGTIRTRKIIPNEPVVPLIEQGMSHVVINTINFENFMGLTPEAWVRTHGGEITLRKKFQITTKEPPHDWLLVTFPSPR